MSQFHMVSMLLFIFATIILTAAADENTASIHYVDQDGLPQEKDSVDEEVIPQEEESVDGEVIPQEEEESVDGEVIPQEEDSMDEEVILQEEESGDEEVIPQEEESREEEVIPQEQESGDEVTKLFVNCVQYYTVHYKEEDCESIAAQWQIDVTLLKSLNRNLDCALVRDGDSYCARK